MIANAIFYATGRRVCEWCLSGFVGEEAAVEDAKRLLAKSRLLRLMGRVDRKFAIIKEGALTHEESGAGATTGKWAQDTGMNLISRYLMGELEG